MTEIWFYSVISVLIISVVSLIGFAIFFVKAPTLNRVLLLLVSLSAGALLGDVFIHLLPQATEALGGFTFTISLSVLAGIAFMFLIEKIIHWRHCHVAPGEVNHPHPFATMNLIGDFAHNALDGLIVGASFLVSLPVGLATTIAVILHEIPQEISDFGVLLQGGYSKKKALALNFLMALSALLGVVIALLIGGATQNFITYLTPFAAGTFVYIAGSDLIPELHKEVRAKESVFQFMAFGLGILTMLMLLWIE